MTAHGARASGRDRAPDAKPWNAASSAAHPKHAAATADLDKAWQEACALAPTEDCHARALAAERHMERALHRWRHVGAYDSEPIGHVRHRVREHFGVPGGWF